jgi:hypothetical protein
LDLLKQFDMQLAKPMNTLMTTKGNLDKAEKGKRQREKNVSQYDRIYLMTSS